MNKLIKILTPCIFLILFLLFQEQGATDLELVDNSNTENGNCFIQCPISNNRQNLTIDHGIVTINYNPETKFSDWVAYKVIIENLDGPTHTRNWKQDPKIPEEQALKPKDFRGLNAPPLQFDRGHQAPLASFSNHPDWYKTNYLSNITPQKSDLNRGAWVKLESKIRKIARSQKIVFVLTGPYYSNNFSLKLPNMRLAHRIPAGYWKIIVTNKDQIIKLAAFLMPQETNRRDDYCKYLVDTSEITKRTDLSFFDNKILEYQSLDSDLGC